MARDTCGWWAIGKESEFRWMVLLAHGWHAKRESIMLKPVSPSYLVLIVALSGEKED
jgi:hypothetical protein